MKMKILANNFASVFFNASGRCKEAFSILIGLGAMAVFFAGPQVKAGTLYEEMQAQLQIIQSFYETAYAPRDWKFKQYGWSAEGEISKIRQQLRPDTTVQEYQKLLAGFFRSTKDYHVGYSFARTEAANLPFTIKGSDGRYFIVWIDRTKLSEASFPAQVGDEVMEFSGRPVNDVVQELSQEMGNNVPSTDRALAEIALTSRRASRGMDVPRGPVTLKIKQKKTGHEKSMQLIWNYTREFIRDPILQSLSPSNAIKTESDKTTEQATLFDSLNQLRMEFDLKGWVTDKARQLPYGFGKKPFIPALGRVIWREADDRFFDAYIYLNDDRRLIGVVRIASYTPEIPPDEAVQQFGGIIKYFEENTDALVIDQLHNPGGSVFYLYGLASMLAKDPLITPRHRMALSQESVVSAVRLLEETDSIKTDEEARKAMGEGGIGYPIDYTFVQFVREYSRFVIDQWNDGKILTDPYFLFGVDHINPSSVANYTKPIIILVDELDFSGGDFFPTILQDNQRAKILGTRTAGAGGYVLSTQFFNRLGLSSFSFTGSLAERVDKNPIENLGVTPDIPVEFTVNDLQNGFVDYVKRVNEEVNKLL